MAVLDKASHIENVLSSTSNKNSLPSFFSRRHILDSWRRCLGEHGLDPSSSYKPQVLTPEEFRERRERLGDFLPIAKPWVEKLYQQVSTHGNMVLLTDEEGVALEYFENPLFSANSEIPDPFPGTMLSEDQEGTNGVGLCLQEKRPIYVERMEHFRASHIGHTCIVSPVFGPAGQVLAVLNVSSTSPPSHDDNHFYFLQLVNLYAKFIENDHFSQKFKKELVIRISTTQEYSEVVMEALLAVNTNGLIVGADKNAQRMLSNKNDTGLIDKSICDYFDIEIDELMRQADIESSLKCPIYSTDRTKRYFATVSTPENKTSRTVGKASPISVAKPLSAKSLSLDALAGTDPRLAYNAECVKRVMNKNISIILNGETGTGKEAFAQAIHDASERSDRPFVAVNCASIPESLIESELFGYKPGAFTGARNKGMRGKILQSDGGTLFLDEIGDMPATLQTRLLRVLAEQEVTPLGSETPEKVNLHVICATHRNIADLVASGDFREDLYYRLNGVTLKLPALRERSDKASVIEFAFAVEAGDKYDEAEIGEEAFEQILNYSWPGNIRQLRNVLRFALAINEDGVITPQDLPPEFASNSSTLPLKQSFPEKSRDDGEELLSPIEHSEREAILSSLEKYKWNVTESAKELGLARATMYRKMKKYNLVPPNSR